MTQVSPYCIAEIGGNHEGNFDKALALINLAIDTPVDAIKFQTYFADTLVEKSVDPDRWQHFKKFELTLDQHEEIARIITSSGKDYLTSIWDMDAYSRLSQYLNYVKIGSGDMNSYSFLKLAAKTKKPIILSTGLSTLAEVENSIELLRKFDAIYRRKDMITILQCTSMYPIEFNEANLNVLKSLEKFGTNIGYSDHTVGSEALKVATVMGAEMLEFHFTDNNQNSTFRDHLVSLEQADVRLLYKFFQDFNDLQGSSIKTPTKSELQTGHLTSFRRGTYASRDLRVGEIISDEGISEKRPANQGLRFENLLGKKIRKDVKKGAAIFERDIQDEK